jgi:hypothetical protein
LLVSVIASIAFLCPGCAQTPSILTVQSAKRNVAYSQQFGQAFASRTEDGAHEFILVADDAIRSAPREPGGPLTPVAKTPLRQVVHVRVLWEPLNGVEETVTRNASISWFVFTDTAAGTVGIREYQGTAYASVDSASGGNATRVTLRHGTLKPYSSRGSLSDPIGMGKLEGTFTAIRNPNRVRELLAATRARTAEASASVN